jgi:hypothetical protein
MSNPTLEDYMNKIIGYSTMLFLLGSTFTFAAESTATFSAGELTFNADASWKSVKPASAMRSAQFEIPAVSPDTENAEVTVFYFGKGQGGDLDSNLKRWESQFQTPEAKPTAVIEKQTLAQMPVTLLSIEGTYQGAMSMGMEKQAAKPNRAFIGAVIEGPGGNVFFKMLGSKATIEAARPVLLKTLESARAISKEGAASVQ